MPALTPTSCSTHLTQQTPAPLSLRFAPTFFFCFCLRSPFVFFHHILFFPPSVRTLWQPCPSYWGAPLLRSSSGPSTFMISTEMAISTKRCLLVVFFKLTCTFYSCFKKINMFVRFLSVWQEMTDIVKAIYDMMGKYTYPVLKTDAPKQHVDAFFQVTCSRLFI